MIFEEIKKLCSLDVDSLHKKLEPLDEIVEHNDEAISAIQRCGIMCKDENFGLFLKNVRKLDEINPKDPESIANGLRAILGIKSRTELRDETNRIAWNRLLNEYESYCLKN